MNHMRYILEVNVYETLEIDNWQSSYWFQLMKHTLRREGIKDIIDIKYKFLETRDLFMLNVIKRLNYIMYNKILFQNRCQVPFFNINDIILSHQQLHSDIIYILWTQEDGKDQDDTDDLFVGLLYRRWKRISYAHRWRIHPALRWKCNNSQLAKSPCM